MRRSPLGLDDPAVLHPVCNAASAVLHLEDRSMRARFGCKGPAAPAWLLRNGYCLATQPNSARLDRRGILVARLATAEFLIESLDGGAESVCASSQELRSPERPHDLYPVARQDLVIEMGGPGLQTLLRQICSVDFVPLFAAHANDAGPVALTSMMGVSVVAWPRCKSGERGLTVWLDPSFAHYFWTTLLEVARDVGPTVIGSTT